MKAVSVINKVRAADLPGKAVAVMTSKKFDRAMNVLILVMAFLLPCLAFAQGTSGGDAQAVVQAKTQGAYNLTYTFVYGVMGIGLLACYLGAVFGKMEWSRFGQCCGGIVGAGCVTALIQFFS